MPGLAPIRRWLYPVAALTIAALLYVLTTPPEPRDPTADLTASDLANGPDDPTADTLDAPSPTPPSAPPGVPKPPPLQPGCTARAQATCNLGDVWYLDSCGTAHEKKDECGDALCRRGACEALDEVACKSVPLEGECRGDLLRTCVGGQLQEVDCARRAKRCIVSDEGAVCRKPSRHDCTPGDKPTCAGQLLRSCVDGRRQDLDCRLYAATCGEIPGSTTIGCYRIDQLPAPPDPDDPCGPCGCDDETEDGLGADLCDGEDNDHDTRFDEDGGCEPIDLLALVVTDASGDRSHSDEDLAFEVTRINRVLSAGRYPLSVRLAETIELSTPDWLELDEDEYADFVRDPRLNVDREAFYIPVLFTDRIVSDDANKAGKATLPNGRCGGRRVADNPQLLTGAVAVAKGRAPTTVAHEVGHFLGLCHTHFGFKQTIRRIVQWQTASGKTLHAECNPQCVADGDGICDTPPDPGPDACEYNSACDVTCSVSETPDPFNVMSYYTSCRYTVTDLQALEMRRSLTLRRAWYPCRNGACPCDPLATSSSDPEATCPPEMTCRPSATTATADRTGFACSLSGPHPPGAECRTDHDCAESLCIPTGRTRRCARPCTTQTTDCDCRATPGAQVPLCADDLR